MSDTPSTPRRRRWLVWLAPLLVVLLAGWWFGPSTGLYYITNSDPTAGGGVPAPIWQLLIRTDTPSIYAKTNNTDTGWTLVGSSVSAGISDVTGDGVANKAITAIDNTGAATVAYFVNALTSTPAPGQSVTSASLSNNALTLTYSTPIQNDPTGSTLTWVDEGMSNCANNGLVGPYICSLSGTGAAVLQTIADKARPGIMPWATGSTTTGRAGMITNTSAVELGGGTWTYRWVGGPSALSVVGDEYTVELGLMTSMSSRDQTNAVGFLYDRLNQVTGNNNSTNLDKWECYSANNAARTFKVMDGTVVSDGGFTTVNAPVGAVTLPNTNVQSLRIEINAAGTLAEFYVNDVKSCQLTTNLPAATRYAGWGMNIFKSAGSTSINLLYDSSYARNVLTSTRTP